MGARGRYGRAMRWSARSLRPFSAKARCPTCGEQLLYLRWGHEERCNAFVERRNAQLTRIGFVLLVLSLAFMAIPR